jgi:transposase
VGAARNATLGTARSADALGLHLRRHLPGTRTGAGLVLPRCNTAAMALHLAEISQTVTPGAHAVVLLDQAGWHLSDKLDIPANISLMPLPPKSPELNPVENIWQFIRGNWLSNRVFRISRVSTGFLAAFWQDLPTDHPTRNAELGAKIAAGELAVVG